ncbi:MAG: ABC transporter substrate-binding protein [Burkholderiales bacterium]|nr:MAG: ABC transporter substrate-binding protein [Burkholderiales bacterium]
MRLLRRALVMASALAVPQAWLLAQPARPAVPRIGYLSHGSPVSHAHLLEAFRQGLRELGWRDGQNVAIDYRFAEGQVERLAALAAQLVTERVDLIVAVPTAGAVAARRATASIPIVAISVADPVALGLAASLARPGANLTGVSYSVGLESITKALQLFREAIPTASRVAVLSNPRNPGQPAAVADIAKAGSTLGFELQWLQAAGAAEIDIAFAAMVRERAAALFVAPDSLFILHRARLAELSSKHRLPTMHGVRENVDAGGLMSYGPSIVAQARRAAVYVDKILKGAKPGELPIEQPTTFDLVVNLRTARALGITMPQSLLLRADEVIE